MKCVFCGQMIPSDSDFCQYCGEKIGNRPSTLSINPMDTDNKPKEGDDIENHSIVGLDLDNPVPAGGIDAEEEYISKLNTIDGNHISWVRVCSLYSEKLGVMIDKYEGEDEEGNQYGPVYINMYAFHTMSNPVQGFSLSSEIKSTFDPSTRILISEFNNILNSIATEKKDVKKVSKKKSSSKTNTREKDGALQENHDQCKITSLNKKRHIFDCIISVFLVAFIILTIVLFIKNKTLKNELHNTEQLLSSAQVEIERLEKSEIEKDNRINSLLTEKNILDVNFDKAKVKADYFDDIVKELATGNVGYASSHFYTNESVIVVDKNERNRKITLTANWAYGGSVSVSYKPLIIKN